MREIKFRAWDKRLNIMIQNDLMVEAGRQLVIFAKRMRPNQHPDMDNAKGGLLLPTDDSNMVFMQYTGLKDKNGKEIYEGDVLHIEIQDYNTGKSIASASESVEYSNGCFGVVWGWHRDFTMFTGFSNTTFEVIGNIYEHPHLLEGAV